MTTHTLTQTANRLQVLPLQANSRAKRDVWATLNYYEDPGDGSSPMPVYIGGDAAVNEWPTAPAKVLVHDITSEEDKYALDTYGFQLVQDETMFDEFGDDDKIKTTYYPECEKLYQTITQCSQVHIFGHVVRRGPSQWHAPSAGNALKKGPLHRVHVDQSDTGAEIVLRKNFPDLAASLLSSTSPDAGVTGVESKKRWAIVNLWRPLNTIYKDPLAVASACSIRDADLVEAQVVFTKQPPPLNVNKTWTVLPNGEHQWFYKNEMTKREVLMMKCFDTKTEDGWARRAPHCAFVDEERNGEDWADRESVEVRALIVW
ncbi:hypothetical protein BKA66DRAFT_432162 [Pyrenochaeta sp. MPI-SDFR-AT-0127]|nr:hypothetical protein BKA66DRAFT_432162 [Pyrenochaeta sp. MPI-SDFR-AT-0127]